MGEKHGQRPWIKVQLADSLLAHEVADLVKYWKTQRQAAMHIVRAVRLYASLCRGDLALLDEYFPGIFFRHSVVALVHIERFYLPPYRRVLR